MAGHVAPPAAGDMRRRLAEAAHAEAKKSESPGTPGPLRWTEAITWAAAVDLTQPG